MAESIQLNCREIRNGYADWLKRYYWDDFITVTFRSNRREPYYAMKHVWSELQRGNVFRAFMGCEPFKSGDLHIHGLVAGAGAGWRPRIELPWDLWYRLFKRFGRTRVEPANSHEAVTAYCSKYILKQQHIADHYEVFGEKPAWRYGELNIDLVSVGVGD